MAGVYHGAVFLFLLAGAQVTAVKISRDGLMPRVATTHDYEVATTSPVAHHVAKKYSSVPTAAPGLFIGHGSDARLVTLTSAMMCGGWAYGHIDTYVFELGHTGTALATSWVVAGQNQGYIKGVRLEVTSSNGELYVRAVEAKYADLNSWSGNIPTYVNNSWTTPMILNIAASSCTHDGYAVHSLTSTIAGPTPAPTPAPTAGTHAGGDPHLRNLAGYSFDVTAIGNVTLVRLPGSAAMQDADILATAYIQRFKHTVRPHACAPTFITEIVVGGKSIVAAARSLRITPGANGTPLLEGLVHPTQRDAEGTPLHEGKKTIHFHVGDNYTTEAEGKKKHVLLGGVPITAQAWRPLHRLIVAVGDKLRLKVTQHTSNGQEQYLNVDTQGFGPDDVDVGGLLGFDDYGPAAFVDPVCKKRTQSERERLATGM